MEHKCPAAVIQKVLKPWYDYTYFYSWPTGTCTRKTGLPNKKVISERILKKPKKYMCTFYIFHAKQILLTFVSEVSSHFRRQSVYDNLNYHLATWR